MKYRFYKKDGNEWFIDLPQYIEDGGNVEDLQMVAGADTLLDLVSNFKSDVILELSENKFDECEELEYLSEPPVITGCYYHLTTFQNRPFMDIIWLCDVVKYVFNGIFPKSIFFKVIS